MHYLIFRMDQPLIPHLKLPEYIDKQQKMQVRTVPTGTHLFHHRKIVPHTRLSHLVLISNRTVFLVKMYRTDFLNIMILQNQIIITVQNLIEKGLLLLLGNDTVLHLVCVHLTVNMVQVKDLKVLTCMKMCTLMNFAYRKVCLKAIVPCRISITLKLVTTFLNLNITICIFKNI